VLSIILNIFLGIKRTSTDWKKGRRREEKETQKGSK